VWAVVREKGRGTGDGTGCGNVESYCERGVEVMGGTEVVSMRGSNRLLIFVYFLWFWDGI
jgi:hypothetical protein